jgi:hypothetical protein
MTTRTIRVDEEVIGLLSQRYGRSWNARVRVALGLPPSQTKPFEVRIEPTNEWAYAATPEEIIDYARDLLEDARGVHPVPRAAFYANGKLVRGDVTRTDLAVELGRCWCGRGALRGRAGEGWCSAQHEALWGRMSPDVRARVIVARFLRIYGAGR